MPTGGTPETGDVTAGLSEAVIEADTGKKGIPPIDAGTAAVDYAAQQNAAPASVVHVDFRGEAARKAAAKVETSEDPEVAQAVEALQTGRLGYRFAKRAFDIVFSALVLVCLSWLFLIIAILIKLDDPKGPVLFKQRRVGMTKDGKFTYFDMYKFRSMCVDAEAKLAALKSLNEKTGPVFKIAEAQPGRIAAVLQRADGRYFHRGAKARASLGGCHLQRSAEAAFAGKAWYHLLLADSPQSRFHHVRRVG